MIIDPYKVLGISQGASKDEIRKAYRKKAKEYHPDLHPDDPDATRKMNEINEAYDMLTNPEKYAARNAQSQGGAQPNTGGYSQGQQQSYGGYQQQQHQGNYQGAGGWSSDFGGFNFEDLFGFGTYGNQQASTKPEFQPGDSREIQNVVQYINYGRYQEALNILFHIPSTGRNARWYYLSSLANHGAGNTVQAVDHMQKACQLEPNNRTYHVLLQQFRQSGRTYETNAKGFDMHTTNISQLCCGCLALQLCCMPGQMPCMMM